MGEVDSIGELPVVILIGACVVASFAAMVVIWRMVGEAMSDNYRSKHPEEYYDDD